MKVKKILLNVCTMLQLNDVANEIELNEKSEEVNLLLACLNYVNNIIATDYIKIYKTTQTIVSDCSKVIEFSNISNHTFLGIKSVTDQRGNSINFSITDSGIIVNKSGTVRIRYACFPDEVDLKDCITDYKTKINERIFAYGVAAEYLFIKGVIDDASMWDVRFKRELLTITRKLNQTILPARAFK